ncbi:MAG: hypothetical protein RL634_628 [Bacteroidota bacterium]
MIIYIAVTIILFAILMFLYNIRANKHIGFLSAFLIIYALYAIAHYYTFYGTNPTIVAIAWNNFSPVYLLGGPVLLFYIKASLEDKIVFKWYDLLHLLPSILLFIGITPYLFSPFEEKLKAANLIIQDVNNIKVIRMNSIFSNSFIYLSRPTISIFYIIASIILLISKVRKEKKPSRQFKLVTKWLTILLSISFILIIILAIMGSNLFKSDVRAMLAKYQELHSLLGALFLLLPLSLLLFPQILYGVPVLEEEVIKSSNQIQPNKINPEGAIKNGDAFKKLSERILEYFEAEKPYLKQNFSLTELATALNVPQHHISYCFSDFLETNFTKLRASKRVEYAQKLLQQGITKDFTVEKVAELSGFSSRSTFFSTFKEYTGMTPTEFMERNK